MIAKRLSIASLLLILLSVNASAATTVIVQTDKKTDINSIASSLGGTVLDSMSNDSIYLLSVPSMPSSMPLGVVSMSSDKAMILPRFRGAALSVSGSGGGTLPWYANQPAFQLIKAASARAKSTGRGVIIADVDSGIDVSHPALRGHLTTGY